MNDDNTLRAKVRAAVDSGKLPNRRPGRMWGGPGSGARCAVCELPVNSDQLGFEIEFPRIVGDSKGGNDRSQPEVYHAHVRCLAVWEAECQQLGGAPSEAVDDLMTTDADGTIPSRERDLLDQRCGK